MVRVPDSSSKGDGFDSWAVAAEEFCSSRVSFLCWAWFGYPFHPRVTAVARKRSRSFCQKCRWQVTVKPDAPYVCGFAWSDVTWHGAWLYGAGWLQLNTHVPYVCGFAWSDVRWCNGNIVWVTVKHDAPYVCSFAWSDMTWCMVVWCGLATAKHTCALLMWLCMKWRDMVHGCLVRVTAKHACTLCMWLCTKWRDMVHGCMVRVTAKHPTYVALHEVTWMVHGCMVYTEHVETAANTRSTCHVTIKTALEAHHSGRYPKTCCKKLQSFILQFTCSKTNSKHWFTTSFLQPLPYLVTPRGPENCQLTSSFLLVLKQ